jgi:hypothetical protein
MEVTLKIFRYNPEKDKKPSYKTYKLEAIEMDRVLDLLEKVKGYQDGTLSFRRSCAHGICGSDAMRINGMNRLACKTLVRDVGVKITVEPILGLPCHERPDRGYGTVLRTLPLGQAVVHQRRSRTGEGTLPEPGSAPALRRYHQVHPVRLLHHLLPVLLGQ